MGKISKREFIVMTWERLGAGRIGRKKLRAVQNALAKEFGASQSPASIARMLSDAGAELNHPEIIEFDAKWREAQLELEEKKFRGIEDLFRTERLTLARAEELIDRMETLRREFERHEDEQALAQLRRAAVEARTASQALAKDRTLAASIRAEQSELAEWLRVWIQTPALLADWLELRRRSPDFRNKFLTKTSS